MNAPSGVSEVRRVYGSGPDSPVVSGIARRRPYAQTMATFDAVPDGEEFPVSATLFVTFRRCPQQALARLRGIYPSPSRASFRGALAHRLIARHLEQGPIAPADLDRVCREETGANLNGQLAAVGLKPSEFRAVVAEVGELYTRFATLPQDRAVATEVSFDADVGGGITLRGRVDAVFEDEHGSRIVDWKTGRELGEDVDAQLGFYALGWRHVHGSAPIAMDAVSLSTGERRRIEPTERSMIRIEHDIATMVSALRAALHAESDLERTAGPHCRWCPVLDTCAEGSAAMELLD